MKKNSCSVIGNNYNLNPHLVIIDKKIRVLKTNTVILSTSEVNFGLKREWVSEFFDILNDGTISQIANEFWKIYQK